MCVCTTGVCRAHRDQIKVVKPLELELMIVSNLRGVLGTWKSSHKPVPTKIFITAFFILMTPGNEQRMEFHKKSRLGGLKTVYVAIFLKGSDTYGGNVHVILSGTGDDKNYMSAKISISFIIDMSMEKYFKESKC